MTRLLLSLATILSLNACVQLPFLEPPEPKKSKAKPKDDEAEAPKPNKVYTKPAPKPLPEGPADELKGPIVLIEFRAMVNPGMGEFTINSIQRAAKEGAQAVLIELDTPGGLVSTTEKMVQSIMGSPVPVIVYIGPSGAHAASAGTFITLAAHVAVMAPATRIGAAHPVTGSGKDPESEGGEHMGRKVENDLAAMVEGIAKERGRNHEWAIDAVRDSVSADAREALSIGVIDLIASDRAELLEQLNGRELMVGSKKVKLNTKGAQVVPYVPSLREQVLNNLATPGIAMILGLLGLIGIMIEVYHPGVIAPGVMGVLCVILSLISFDQLPIDIGGAILVVAGIGLLIAEIYASTYGALGILGAIGLAAGLIFLIDPSRPDFAVDRSIRLTVLDVVPLVVVFSGFIAFISFNVMRAQKRRVVTGQEALVGMAGTVLKSIDGEGMVLVDGEYWRATAKEAIAEGQEIVVVSIDGLMLEVKKRP